VLQRDHLGASPSDSAVCRYSANVAGKSSKKPNILKRKDFDDAWAEASQTKASGSKRDAKSKTVTSNKALWTAKTHVDPSTTTRKRRRAIDSDGESAASSSLRRRKKPKTKLAKHDSCSEGDRSDDSNDAHSDDTKSAASDPDIDSDTDSFKGHADDVELRAVKVRRFRYL
jgi:hypothetical protein